MAHSSKFWIWNGHEEYKEKRQKCELLYFRRTFMLREIPASMNVKVSADSRYRLYINGVSVSIGPCKSGVEYTFYEEVDISKYLRVGKNVLAAKVLHLAQITPYVEGSAGADSITRTCCGGFLLEGIVTDMKGNTIENIGTDSHWKVIREDGIEFVPGTYGLSAMLFEVVKGGNCIKDWNKIDYDDTLWKKAVAVCDSSLGDNLVTAYGIPHWWKPIKRPIPQLYEKYTAFLGVAASNCDKTEISGMLKGENCISIVPNSQCFIELDAGELTTGYFCLKLTGGKGSIIRMTYSECYEEYSNGKYRKGKRDDPTGVLRGDWDLYQPGGEGEYYETFWFRAFRYIRLDIVTSAEALTIEECFYRETGYPLNVISTFNSEDIYINKMWQISLRTLKRCMHETYEDCPYYEQLQYLMDTRLQALYTYRVSNDDRLARKAINDFHQSLMPSGLLQSRYPSVIPQVIPLFSLHWIFMIEDHLKYFGDTTFVRRYRSVIDLVLDWFDRKITGEGLVGKLGYWPFVDWVEGWEQNSIPPAYLHGPVTVDSLVYACALESAAVINEHSGRSVIAEEYRIRADNVKEAVEKHCWDDSAGLYMDGPGVKEYSQHAQIWAVLAGTIEDNPAVQLMERTMNEKMSQVSYAMSFFLFRALEKTGLYSKYAQGLLNVWRGMIDQNLTTWVEDPVSQRSDCHGWGALPLYELTAVILGVKAETFGEKVVRIKPVTCDLEFVEGTAMTCNGPVNVKWSVNGHEFEIFVSGPEGIEYSLELPNGRIFNIERNVFTEKYMLDHSV